VNRVIRGQKISRSKRIFFLVAIIGVILAGVLALPHHPLVQERRFKDMPLAGFEGNQKTFPDSPIFLYYWGTRLNETKRFDEAVPVLQRAILSDLDAPRLRAALSQSLLALGRTHDAYTQLEQYRRTHPTSEEGVLMLARFYLTVRSYRLAIDLLKPSCQQFPTSAECYALLAIAYNYEGGSQHAAKAAAEAVRLQPKASKYWSLQAQVLLQSQATLAKDSYEQAIRLAPDDYEVQADFAYYLARAQKMEEAEALARTVLKKLPNNLHATSALAIALSSKNAPESLDLLLDGLKGDPKDYLLIQNIIRQLHRLGREKETKEWEKRLIAIQEEKKILTDLRTRLEKNPGDTDALHQFALYYAYEGDAFQCLQYHARAQQAITDAPGPLLAAARDLITANHPQLAEPLLRQLLTRSPNGTQQQEATRLLQHPR
jgi:cytochrome c-type biogenesis protein CcmH/NrfG